MVSGKSVLPQEYEIKALTAKVGRFSLSVGWENNPERGLKTISFNPDLP